MTKEKLTFYTEEGNVRVLERLTESVNERLVSDVSQSEVLDFLYRDALGRVKDGEVEMKTPRGPVNLGELLDRDAE